MEDLASDDFEHLRAALSKTRDPVALGNEIQRIRVVCKYAYDAEAGKIVILEDASKR